MHADGPRYEWLPELSVYHIKPIELRPGPVKLPAETVLATLLYLNRCLCKPSLPADEIRSIAASAAKGEARTGNFVARLLCEVELGHDANDDPFVMLPQDDHEEH